VWQLIKEALGILNVIGMPTVIAWALYDRRRIRNEGKQGELEVQEAEATLPNRVKTSSVVTLEAELLALSRTFEMDREAKERTIAFQAQQLSEARRDIAEREAVIDSLREKVAGLQRQVNAVTSELADVHRQLDRVTRNNPQQQK
jgi:septal ring factor EnvC (AmiA/AmiB activator)